MKKQRLIIMLLILCWFSTCKASEEKELYYFANTNILAAEIDTQSSEILCNLQNKDSFIFYSNEEIIIADKLSLHTTKTKGLAYLIIDGHSTDEKGVKLYHKVAYPIIAKDNNAKAKILIAHQCVAKMEQNCQFKYNESNEICGCKCVDCTNTLETCNHSITTILQPLQPQ